MEKTSRAVFGSYCFLLLVHSSVYAIYDPNVGVKTTRRDLEPVSEPIVMHHSYSQVASNRPIVPGSFQSQFSPTRQGKASYTNDAENHVAQYGLECPPNATGQYPYLMNCRQFLNCWKGRGHIQNCAPGTAFNPDTRECDNPEKVICLNYRSETNPNSHFAKLRKLESESSPPLAKNSESLSSGSGVDSVRCAPESNGLQPHPFDCARFLQCANGITYTQVCGPGTVFNAVLLVCDFPYNVDCSSRGGTPSNDGAGQSSSERNRETNAHQGEFLYHRHHNRNQQNVGQSTRPTEHSVQQVSGNEDSSTRRVLYNNQQTLSGSTPFSNSQPDRIGHAYNYNHGSSRPYNHHQSHHHSHHHPGNTYHGSQQPSQAVPNVQQTTWSHTAQGNRDPKLDWNTSGEDSSQIQSSRSYNVEQARVNQLAKTDANSKNSTTVYYAQPVGNMSGTRNKTTVYYAQPVGRYYPSQSGSEHASTPTRKELWEMDLNQQQSNTDELFDAQSREDVTYGIPGQKQNTEWSPKIPHQTQVSSGGHGHLDNNRPVADSSNLFGGLLPPLMPSQAASTQRAYATPANHLQPPPSKPAPHTVPFVPIPFGDLLPPLPDNKPNGNPIGSFEPAHQEVLPHLNRSQAASNRRTYAAPANHLEPPPPEPAPPTVPFVPIPFGDLLPPLPDNRPNKNPEGSFESAVLYPPPEPTLPLNSARPSQVPTATNSGSNFDIASSVVYSPSYSGVMHSKPTQERRNTTKDEEEVFKAVMPLSSRRNVLNSGITLNRSSTYMPPPYNHDYYNPPEARRFFTMSTTQKPHQNNKSEIENLVMSEALKMLLRPYFNRSGTVTDDVVVNLDEHIMKLSPVESKAQTASPPPKPIEFETETIFSGEQANMNEGTHHQYDPTLDVSGENTTEEIAHQGGSRHHNHHHFHNHRQNPHSNHSSHRHGHHHWHHYRHGSNHSRDYHRTHPELPNPFSANDLDDTNRPQQGTDVIDVRSDENNRRGASGSRYPALDADKPACQFDCGNGKCIREYQVCDGVNNCGNRRDEQICDHLGYEVRLSGEEGKANMGRVEVKVNGKWGYVCDDKFGMRAAEVLCRELGFALGASEVRANSYYTAHREMYDNGNVRYLMDEVDCFGNETSIRECNFKGWGVHDCSEREVVGVVCKVPVLTCPPDYWLCKTSQECVAVGYLCDSIVDCQDGSDEGDQICNQTIRYRLIGGNNEMEGRVEVKYRDAWGTICDDDFGKKEAQVVCRSLGYLGEANVILNMFGQGKGPIWLDQVSCIGNETSLDKCQHWAWGEHNCDHKEDVSVRCSELRGSPLAAVTTSTPPKPKVPEPVGEEDIDLFLYKVQRSSKALNQDKRCGHINEHAVDEFYTSNEFARVVQGTRALRGQHPWQASLRAKGRNGMSSHWCGAILITQMHVLTAAHCLVGYQKEGLFVRMGDHYSKIAEPSEIDGFIQNWYVHEEFRKGHHMNNDIGLIVLKSPVIFNDYIQPICLPPKDAKYDEGMQCTISGWGSIKSGISTPSNNLKAAHVPLISQNICKEPYVYGNAITDGMFCAGYLDEGVDACDGDSGGPLACSTPNGETLYGIISWGQHCGQANKPGVYVKVSHYLDWITEKIMISIKAKKV